MILIKTKPKTAMMRRLADFGIMLLIALVVGLPLYIKWSGSKLSYTPEPTFPASTTNHVSSSQN